MELFRQILSFDSTSGRERELGEWLAAHLEAPSVETFEVGDGTLNVALKKPMGMVVAGITLPTDEAFLSDRNYLGPAKVTISGGSGFGATAVTEYDATTRTLTAVTIASPGYGFIEGDSVTATVEGPFRKQSYACKRV